MLHEKKLAQIQGWKINYRSKASLSFHNAVWDLHFAAQSRKPNYKLYWVNIMGNDNQLSLTLKQRSKGWAKKRGMFNCNTENSTLDKHIK